MSKFFYMAWGSVVAIGAIYAAALWNNHCVGDKCAACYLTEHFCVIVHKFF